jgi:hypothetical protein
LIEYEGKLIYFEYNKHFHKTKEGFISRQAIDVLKTKTIIENDRYLIRIGYTSKTFDDIESSLLKGLASIDDNHRLYLSYKPLYQFLLDGLVGSDSSIYPVGEVESS